MNDKKYIIGIHCQHNPIQPVNSVVCYDLLDRLGGTAKSGVIQYDLWCYLRTLSRDPVEIWQTLPIKIGQYTLLMLVDETGLLHEEPDPPNWLATILARQPYTIHGDVFLVDVKGENVTCVDDSTASSLMWQLGAPNNWEPVIIS